MSEQTIHEPSTASAGPRPISGGLRNLLARPAWIAAAYAALGLAWINYSDSLLLRVAPDLASVASIGRLKGMVFVLFTGLLLYRLLLRQDEKSSRRQDAEQAERHRAWRMLEAIAESAMRTLPCTAPRNRAAAEGVETAQQRDYLRQQGCDEMQGYRFARPAPAQSLQQRLAAEAHAMPTL